MLSFNRSHLNVVYLILLLAAGLFTRWHHVDNYAYGPDQVMHIQIAEGHSLSEVWQFSRYETHPPFGHFIRYFWMKISTNIEWVRSLSFASDMGLILLFFLLGERIQRNTGLIAATIAAFSPAFITLSQEIRNYSLFMLFFVACLYCYFRFIDPVCRSIKWLGLYTLCGCLAISTYFGGIIPLFAMTVVTFFTLYKERKLCAFWLAANSLIGLLFLFFYFAQQWTLYVYSIALPHDSAYFLSLVADTLKGSILFPAYLLLKLPDDYQAEVVSLLFFLTLIVVERIRKIYPFLFIITVMSVALWAILCLCAVYTPQERHSLWVAPFIILVFSLAIKNCYDALSNPLLKRSLACFCIIPACWL